MLKKWPMGRGSCCRKVPIRKGEVLQKSGQSVGWPAQQKLPCRLQKVVFTCNKHSHKNKKKLKKFGLHNDNLNSVHHSYTVEKKINLEKCTGESGEY